MCPRTSRNSPQAITTSAALVPMAAETLPVSRFIVLALGRPPSRRVAFMPSTRVVFTLPNSGSCVPGMGYEKTSCGHEIPATTTPTAAGWNG